jgi:site-specific recombinase XerD
VNVYKTHLLQVRSFKPATANRELASISAFCEWASTNSFVRADPTEGIGNVQEAELARRWLTKKEQYTLLRAVQKEGNTRDEAVIMLLLHRGLRVSEASSPRLSDIEISERKGQLTVRDGKGGRHRVVPLNVEVRRVFAAYLEMRPDAARDHLFAGKRASRLKPWWIQ